MANLAGSGCRSESNSNVERRLLSPLSDPAKTNKIPHGHKLLRTSPQEQLPVGGIGSADRQECSGTGTKSNFSGLFQPTVFGSKTKQQVETHSRSEQVKSLSQGGEIQDGNTGNHQNLPSARGMGHVHRLQGRLLPYSHTGTVQEVSQISCPRPDISIQGSPLWPIHSTHGIYCGSERSEADGHTQGYKDPPVPRRLVGQSQVPPSLSPAYPNAGENVPRPWLASEFGKIRTGAKTGFQLCRLPVRSQVRSGLTHTGPVAKPTGKVTVTACTTGSLCP